MVASSLHAEGAVSERSGLIGATLDDSFVAQTFVFVTAIGCICDSTELMTRTKVGSMFFDPV